MVRQLRLATRETDGIASDGTVQHVHWRSSELGRGGIRTPDPIPDTSREWRVSLAAFPMATSGTNAGFRTPQFRHIIRCISLGPQLGAA